MSPWKKRERELNARYVAGQNRVLHKSTEWRVVKDYKTGKEKIVTVGVTYYKPIGDQ